MNDLFVMREKMEVGGVGFLKEIVACHRMPFSRLGLRRWALYLKVASSIGGTYGGYLEALRPRMGFTEVSTQKYRPLK